MPQHNRGILVVAAYDLIKILFHRFGFFWLSGGGGGIFSRNYLTAQKKHRNDRDENTNLH
jgi:hypothetical protein